MSIEILDSFFNSSARSGGARYFKEGRVSFSKPSSNEISSYVKPNFRVSLKSESYDSKNIMADCNCPPSQKGQLCKHIYAVFLAVSEKSPDFFENKKEIQKSVGSTKATKPISAEQEASKAAFKEKQNDYRKEQYQKQKERLKKIKNSKKNKSYDSAPSFPADIQLVIDYFTKNGFPFDTSVDENAILFARKKLARIFHPDAGGSHDESTELNSNSDILLKYIGKS
ncbi:MAG: SWIM zinc finger family protein [Pseudobdellovibrio sp.]